MINIKIFSQSRCSINKVAVSIPKFSILWRFYSLLTQVLSCPWMLRQPTGLARNFQELIYVMKWNFKNNSHCFQQICSSAAGSCQPWLTLRLHTVYSCEDYWLAQGLLLLDFSDKGASIHPQLPKASFRRHCLLGSPSVLCAACVKNVWGSNVLESPEKSSGVSY